jgi:hypothetical protein
VTVWQRLAIRRRVRGHADGQTLTQQAEELTGMCGEMEMQLDHQGWKKCSTGPAFDNRNIDRRGSPRERGLKVFRVLDSP